MFHVSPSFLKISRYCTSRLVAPYIASDQMQQRQKSSSSANRGTGAGGAQTNRNGLAFERCVYPNVYVKGQGGEIDGYWFLKQRDFAKHMKPVDPNMRLFHPDGAYIKDDWVMIIECKYQGGSGSVDEKILNSPTKLELYKQAYPHVKDWCYVLVLSEWFRQPSYKTWIDTLTRNPEIQVWWAEKRTHSVCVKLEVDGDAVKVHLSNYQLVP